jgi:hypothetical protein
VKDEKSSQVKNEKKKQKKNKKKEEAQKKSAAPADLGEMLLKSGNSQEIQPFAVEGLFIDT